MKPNCVCFSDLRLAQFVRNKTSERSTTMLLLLLLCLASCGQSSANVDSNQATETAAEAEGRYFTQLYKRSLRPMVGMVNQTAAPCDDFYAHACGSSEGTVDQLPPYLYNKEDRMHFFEAQLDNFQTLPGQLLAQLYAECKQRGEQHVLSPQPPRPHWLRLREELPFLATNAQLYAQWPHLRHHGQRQLDWITLAAQLAAHGVATLLHIYYAEGTIYIAPMPQLLCPSLEEFRSSMASVLRGRHVQVARIVAQELRTLCRGMRGELPLTKAAPQNQSEQQLPADANLGAYLQRYFALMQFSEEQLAGARKLPLDVERIGRMWQVLGETEPRIVHNYVLWQAQQQLLYADCYQLTAEFERLLQAEYWAWHVLSAYYPREVALAMFQYHTTRYQQQRRLRHNSRDWYELLLPAAATAQRQSRDWQLVRMLQAHAQRYLNLSELREHYGELEFRPGQFYANLLALRRAKLRASFATPWLDDEYEDVDQPAYFLRHFLHFCLLTLSRPLYHYYASQGLALWQRSSLLSDSDGYYTALDCLERQSLLQSAVNGSTASADLYRLLGSHEVADIVRFQGAFAAALRDYRFWLQGERFAFAEDFVLQYFGLDAQRVLYYAVAQQLCHRQVAIFAARLNRSFMNLREFQLAFNCSAQAPMNPPAKCMLGKH